MDFYQIRTRETRAGTELYPDFIVGQSKDLMVQGGKFYAIWDAEKGMWSRDDYDVQRLVDEELQAESERKGPDHNVKYMRSFSSGSWTKFQAFLSQMPDYYRSLDGKIMFANSEIKKTDYASKTLPYSMEEGGATPAWDELIGTLYSPEERTKIEWAIGSIVAGNSKRIQKFLVFYGSAGTGKSTVLNLIEQLFEGYTAVFDAKALGSSNGSFATEVFKNRPLVAIQHDGDLSRIEDNTRLNSIVAHEEMSMNEKYKPTYQARVDAFLFMGTNQPVKISDAKSGLIRRLIDVHPTGARFPPRHYFALMKKIEFELGAVAFYCWSVFQELGPNYYNTYRPLEMMFQTDVFFNFIEAHYDIFKSQDMVTLKQAYSLYKEYCEETGIGRPLPMYKMREELRNYFDEFKTMVRIDGEQVRSVYSGFSAEKFKAPVEADGLSFSLVVEEKESLLDGVLAEQPAQYVTDNGTPKKAWGDVTSKLVDIDSRKMHFVKVPPEHIVIDFDLEDVRGRKALDRNLEAASSWPATYAEISKSGSGVHLHYIYRGGSVEDLSPVYADGIEVKVYSGNASLRRMLSRCNAVPIAEISGGLPLKKKKEKMLKEKTIASEKGLRELIHRNLKKEIHPGTKPSVDFIKKVLDDAYDSGIKYDVTDLRNQIIAFANNSSNQAQLALKVVKEMKFTSEDEDADKVLKHSDDRIAFFDVEVYPNLLVICWKFQGSDDIVKMVNPKAHEVEALFSLKLVGFYNRRYDNHILYAASLGKTNEELFKLSMKLIEGTRSASYGMAYNLSYADIWDFSSVKQGLKKFEIDLGILHMELDLPWDKPVDEDDIDRVVEYCINDVRATEAVFEDRKGDFVARQILAELSGLTVNDTTQRHTAKIIFGDEKNPQKQFVYTDLSKEFDGYQFELGKSYYRGEEPGEGGYVYAEPGMYENVAVLDVASMHPASIRVLNLFGPYTQRYSDLTDARVAIKRQEYDRARTLLDGRLARFLERAEDDPDGGKALAQALKIVVNIVYGLTSAKFENPFKDIRNVDNIVAKRGALFMIELKHALQEKGIQVIHIKTDSVKIPLSDLGIIDFIIAFGKEYGYDFEHEVTYDRFCLVNDAVYIAGLQYVPWEINFPQYQWTAVGAQFQHPYVFKSLFSGEQIVFDDYCEGKSVNKGTMYLDRHQVGEEDYRNMRHIGKTGLFVPVTEGGGVLYRVNEDKYYAVSGTKNHQWMEADVAVEQGDNLEIDYSYFEKLKNDAIKAIEQFGSFEELVK